MKNLVLIAAGKRDDRGNIFKPSREKASRMAAELPKIVNKSSAYVHDGTSGAINTIRCVLDGANLPEEWANIQEFEKLSPAYSDGPIYTEFAQSLRFLRDLDTPNVVVCVDLSYLLAFAQHILGRELKYQVEEADAVVITFGDDGLTPHGTTFASPYVG